MTIVAYTLAPLAFNTMLLVQMPLEFKMGAIKALPCGQVVATATAWQRWRDM